MEVFSILDVYKSILDLDVFKCKLKSCFCPVGWGCRIHRLLLCQGLSPPPQRVSWIYDTKQSDGEVPAMLELWGMWSTLLLPLLPSSLWPGVVAPDKGPIYGLNRTKWWLTLTVFIHLNYVFMLNWIVYNRTKLYLNLKYGLILN